MNKHFANLLFVLLLTLSSFSHAAAIPIVSPIAISPASSPVIDGEMVSGGALLGLEGHFGDGTMEWEIAANDINSYPGTGQSVTSIVATPNSGATTSQYGFTLGETSSVEASDPTFNVDTFDHDGTDWFNSTEASQSSLLDTICYDTMEVTFFIVFDIGSTLDTTDFFYLTDQSGGANCNLGLATVSNGDLRISQSSGSGGSNFDLAIGMATSTTDNVLIVSIDMLNSRIDAWYNSDTPVVLTSVAFDGTNTSTTSDPFGPSSGATSNCGTALKLTGSVIVPF